MYLLIKLNPNALPGSQDARHQCSLKIIQLTILRLMTAFPPPSELFSIFNQSLSTLFNRTTFGNPNTSLVETQGSSLNDLIFTPQMTLMATTCLPLPSSSLWFTTLTHTTVLPTKWWHSSSVPGLAPIHVIAERFCPRVCWTHNFKPDAAWHGHQDLLPSKFPFHRVDPHGGIPYIGPLPYHQSLFSGLDLMILLYRKHTRGGFPGGSA